MLEQIPDREFLNFLEDRDGSPSPSWLQSVTGSLAEERRRSLRRSYTSYNREVRKFQENFRSFFNLNYLLSNCSDFLTKLASAEGDYPHLGLSLNINLQKLTGDRIKDLRSFLVYYLSFENIPPWIAFLIDEKLDQILKESEIIKGSIKCTVEGEENNLETYRVGSKTYTRRYTKYTQASQRYIECLTIYKIYTLLGREQAYQLIEGLYSKNTLETWKQKARVQASKLDTVSISEVHIKEKIRRRGNSHSSSDPNSLKSQRRKVSNMIKKEEEIRNLEETILRIKNKQAKLFEKRLDAFLALEDETLSQQERRMVFNSILAGDSFIPNQEDDPNILKTSERREEDEEDN